MEKMSIKRSKTGLPIINEEGGGSTSTGNATICCGCNGEPLTPLFIPRGYCNGEHALFVAKVGVFIVRATHSRRGESVRFHRIVQIGTEEDQNEIILEENVYEYEDGDGNIPEEFESAKQAALNKSHCYHCRCAHYYKS